MRRKVETNGVTVQAIAGTNAVYLGFDLDAPRRDDCLGFALHREDHTEHEQYWLSGFKTFRSVVPVPNPAQFYSSRDHPIQSFSWGDYTAKPRHRYTYRVVPRYESPKNLCDRPGVEAAVDVSTGDPDGGVHGIYFNRGVAASQAYANRFGVPPRQLPPERQPEAFAWLSRGLNEALIRFIAQADSPAFALRGAVYQFTQEEILAGLRQAHLRGADVRILFHAVDDGEGAANVQAVEAARIKGLTIPRTHAHMIAHNKFLVLCRKDAGGALDPIQVWTGSTNLSDGGIFGHSNVGHVVRDAGVAGRYLAAWTQLAEDPERDVLRPWIDSNDPFGPNDVQAGPAIHVLFSPRTHVDPLNWYADGFGTKDFTAITVPFGLSAPFEQALRTDGDVIHYVMLNTTDNNQEIWATNPKVQVAVGSSGGPDSLARWARETLSGLNRHALYIHTKVLLIDPLTADPTVITGSANFSVGSTTGNDENMLVIRGDLEVADVYFTEYSRIFQHLYARYWARRLRNPSSPDDVDRSFLDETPAWLTRYFTRGNPKHMQRVIFASRVEGNV
jgi:phosphatidylserine/phosphatidylglycerophosphate/cardiolipin synthase-like enzyme